MLGRNNDCKKSFFSLERVVCQPDTDRLIGLIVFANETKIGFIFG
jgi:hypothetical protein